MSAAYELECHIEFKFSFTFGFYSLNLQKSLIFTFGIFCLFIIHSDFDCMGHKIRSKRNHSNLISVFTNNFLTEYGYLY